jgi:5,10-methylenetetrahydrofolate reductase
MLMSWTLKENVYEYLPPLKTQKLDLSFFDFKKYLSIAHTPYSSNRYTPLDVLQSLDVVTADKVIPHIKTGIHINRQTLLDEVARIASYGVRRALLVSGDKNGGASSAGPSSLDVLEELCLAHSLEWAVAVDPYVGETEFLRARLKIERGAVSLWTQPIFDLAILERLSRDFSDVAVYVSIPFESELSAWPRFRRERLGAREWTQSQALRLRDEALALGLRLKIMRGL